MTRTEQISHFVTRTLGADHTLSPLAGDASFRRYVRVAHADKRYMLMDAPPDKENVRPFITVDHFLVAHGYSAPVIVAQDAQQWFLLLEDLGDDTFSRLLNANPSREEEYYEAAISLLAEWHRGALPVAGLDVPDYDHAVLMREVQLLSNWFLPQLLDGAALADAQASYVACWERLLAAAPLATSQFVHRDYHADNLMWLPERAGAARVGLLDFQDALKGDAAYDVVSLLEDARRDVSPLLASRMRALYLERSGASPEQFDLAYALLAAQRNAKIVGVFTRLAARDGRPHYLDYLPRVWRYLEADAEHPALVRFQAWLALYVPKDKRHLRAITKSAAQLGLAA